MASSATRPPLPHAGEGRGEGIPRTPAGSHSITFPSLDPRLLANAPALRGTLTDAERLLWALLRNRRLADLKFRRQLPVAPYVVDFACLSIGLAVELDGGQHAEDAQRRHDAVRTAYLRDHGLAVMRFWNNEVLQQTEAVLQQIWNRVHEGHPHPNPLPHAGEGVQAARCLPPPLAQERGDEG